MHLLLYRTFIFTLPLRSVAMKLLQGAEWPGWNVSELSKLQNYEHWNGKETETSNGVPDWLLAKYNMTQLVIIIRLVFWLIQSHLCRPPVLIPRTTVPPKAKVWDSSAETLNVYPIEAHHSLVKSFSPTTRFSSIVVCIDRFSSHDSTLCTGIHEVFAEGINSEHRIKAFK